MVPGSSLRFEPKLLPKPLDLAFSDEGHGSGEQHLVGPQKLLRRDAVGLQEVSQRLLAFSINWGGRFLWALMIRALLLYSGSRIF